MPRSVYSIAAAVICSATLALGAVAARGQELPSPPAHQSVLGQRPLQNLLRGLPRHVGARRRPGGGEPEEAAARSDAVRRQERRYVPIRAGRPDHRRTAAGHGAWRSRHARLGRGVQGVTSGILGRVGPGADPGARRIPRVDSGTARAIAIGYGAEELSVGQRQPASAVGAIPPSIPYSVPVTAPALGDTTNAMSSATSRGFAGRPAGCHLATA